MKLSASKTALPLLAVALTGLGFYHVSTESRSAPPATPPENPARSPYVNSIAASGVPRPVTGSHPVVASKPGTSGSAWLLPVVTS